MFGSSSERAAHAETIAVYNRLVDVLAEQIDYLRLQLALRPAGFVPNAPAINPTNQPVMQEGVPAYVSEQEAEFRQMFADGLLDEEELQAALQTFGFGSEAAPAEDPSWTEEV